MRHPIQNTVQRTVYQAIQCTQPCDGDTIATEHSGSGGPARGIALPWRTRERSSRRGASGLSAERIVRAAIEVADSEGLAVLSMRRVAERLKAGTMSLYTYVPGKAELLAIAGIGLTEIEMDSVVTLIVGYV